MSLFAHFTYSLLATIGYAIFFQLPKKLLIYAGLTGAIGWIVNVLLTQADASLAFANLAAAIAVAVMSEIFSRISRNPVTMFVIPGILPITPGYSLYMTMYYFTQNQIENALSKGLQTLAIAGAIAIGIMLVSSFGKISRNIIARRLMKDRHDV